MRRKLLTAEGLDCSCQLGRWKNKIVALGYGNDGVQLFYGSLEQLAVSHRRHSGVK